MATQTSQINGLGRALIVIFLGLLVTAFIQLGTAAFYPAPQPPVYPASSSLIAPPSNTDQSIYQAKSDAYYNVDSPNYTKRVVSINLAIAALIVIFSLLALKGIPLFSDSLLLSGIFIVIYNITLASSIRDARFEFVVVTLSLVVTTVICYYKLVKPGRVG